MLLQLNSWLIERFRAHQLCAKLLGLEETDGSCFAFQLGRCKGACAGREPPLMHRMRVMLALSSLKLKAWPFPGRIALREGRDEHHVLDRWAYLGTARTEEELHDLAADPAPCAFDPDVYRILVRYLGRHPQPDWHPLPIRSDALP